MIKVTFSQNAYLRELEHGTKTTHDMVVSVMRAQSLSNMISSHNLYKVLATIIYYRKAR